MGSRRNCPISKTGFVQTGKETNFLCQIQIGLIEVEIWTANTNTNMKYTIKEYINKIK